MANTPRAVDRFLADLEQLGLVRARAMFGGHGVYCDDLFFAIIIENHLYLKADEALAKRFITRGMEPFTYAGPMGRPVVMAYYRVVQTDLDHPDALMELARQSVDVARRVRGQKHRSRRTRPGF